MSQSSTIDSNNVERKDSTIKNYNNNKYSNSPLKNNKSNINYSSLNKRIGTLSYMAPEVLKLK